MSTNIARSIIKQKLGFCVGVDHLINILPANAQLFFAPPIAYLPVANRVLCEGIEHTFIHPANKINSQLCNKQHRTHNDLSSKRLPICSNLSMDNLSRKINVS